MALSRRKMQLVVALAIASFIGIIVVQLFWINSAYNNEEKKFYSDVKLIGIELQNIIKEDTVLQQSLIDLSSSEKPDSSRLRVYKDKLAATAESLFTERDNNIEYEFGLVSHNRDQNDCCHLETITEEEVVFSTMDTGNTDPILNSKYHICASALKGYGHLNFYYPGIDSYLLARISDIITFSVLCILIVGGCITFAFRTIRKQRDLSEMKNDFINNMTHEFKTPIFSISLASRALGDIGEIQKSDKMQEYLRLIREENERLKTQVDKVLQMAQVNANNTSINKEPIDLHDIIRQSADNFELQLSDRNGSINLELNASKSIVQADETHISNVINNLIDNAIKYSREEPDITISTSDQRSGIIFCINDNGIGIDAESRKHIFDKFYRANTEDNQNRKGFGLGLSYVKNIIEAHEGWIKLKSKLNKGSTFTIFLPA